MKFIVFIIGLTVSIYSYSYTLAEGTIKEVYIDKNGTIAIILNEGYSAEVSKECSGNNGYAGIRTADPAMKSLLLAAYASKARVKLGIIGCDGNWLKINDVRAY